MSVARDQKSLPCTDFEQSRPGSSLGLSTIAQSSLRETSCVVEDRIIQWLALPLCVGPEQDKHKMYKLFEECAGLQSLWQEALHHEARDARLRCVYSIRCDDLSPVMHDFH
eukprot:6438925-Amphidinium_carterae.1